MSPKSSLILTVTAIMIVAMVLGEQKPLNNSSSPPPPEATSVPLPSWNLYLGTYHNIFPPDLDVIKSDLTHGDALRAELTKILDDPAHLSLIYKNFVDGMKDCRRPGNGDKNVSREAIFKEKLFSILQHNVEYYSGRTSWRKGATCFADWTDKEFQAIRG